MALQEETIRKRLKMSKYLMLFALIGSTNAAPQPDAAPDASPDAKPDADPNMNNYGAPVISSNPYGGQGAYMPNPFAEPQQNSPVMPYPNPSPCQMSSECCGIAESCYGYSGCGEAPAPDPGPVCYNVWKYNCVGGAIDQVQSVQKFKKHCININVPTCRMVTETITRQAMGEQCYPVPLTQRFTYTKKVADCNQWANVPSSERWTNDKVVQGESQVKQHCLQVKTFTCKPVIRNQTDTKTVKIPKRVPYQVQKCNRIRVPGVPTTKTITRTKYKKVCWEVPVEPSCTQTPCVMGSGCSQSQSPCSLNEYNTVDTCSQARYKREADADANYPMDPLGPGGIQPISPLGPGGIEPIGPLGPGGMEPIGPLGPGGIEPIAPLGPGGMEPMPMPGPVPDGGCGSIRQPVCAQSSGGSCVGGMQQCCEQQTRTKTTCKKVPYNVQEVITVPGQDSWQKKCRSVTKYKYTYETKVITGTAVLQDKKCFPNFKQTCVQLRVPTYRVGQEQGTGQVTLKSQSCKIRVVTQTFTKTIPDGDVKCEKRVMPKQLQITRRKCDSSNSKQYCFNVPYTDAKIMPGRGGKCWWIPTKKCIEQPKCETPPNPKCGQCDTWRRNDGFATCPTNTCGTYIPGGTNGDGGSFGGNVVDESWGGNNGGIVDVSGDDGAIGGDGGCMGPGCGGGDGGIIGGLSSLAQQDVKEDVESFAEEKFEDKMDDLLSR